MNARRFRFANYEIEADHNGIEVSFEPDFWDQRIINRKGVTAFDVNVAQILGEIKAALYLVADDRLIQQ